jgi:hypothetical protein
MGPRRGTFVQFEKASCLGKTGQSSVPVPNNRHSISSESVPPNKHQGLFCYVGMAKVAICGRNSGGDISVARRGKRLPGGFLGRRLDPSLLASFPMRCEERVAGGSWASSQGAVNSDSPWSMRGRWKAVSSSHRLLMGFGGSETRRSLGLWVSGCLLRLR